MAGDERSLGSHQSGETVTFFVIRKSGVAIPVKGKQTNVSSLFCQNILLDLSNHSCSKKKIGLGSLRGLGKTRLEAKTREKEGT